MVHGVISIQDTASCVLCISKSAVLTSRNISFTGPRCTVGYVSGYRCEADCRSRVASLIPAKSHTFMEIDHEIISMVILLPSVESFMKGFCLLQAKVCAQSTG